MKFIKKILCCRKADRAGEKVPDPEFKSGKSKYSKGKYHLQGDFIVSADKHWAKGGRLHGQLKIPKWIEMKGNALIYLKQLMKHNRRKKIQMAKKDKVEEEKEDPNKVKNEDEAPEILEKTELEPIKEIDELTNDNISMMCPLCHFFMNKTVCTSCGHMFCQYGLDEYFIFKDSCPVCEKACRRHKITRCGIADSAIDKLITFSSDEIKSEWEKKKAFEGEYYASKQVNEKIIDFSVPSKESKKIMIDARDSEYIWGTAEVMALIESKDKDNSVLVHYEGWGRKYDEVLPLSSPRIASLGFFTQRTDIPHYQETDNKSKKPVLNLPVTTEKIEIIEELKKDGYKCLEDGDEANPNRTAEGGDDLQHEEEIYEYLIDKVSSSNRGGRDLRSTSLGLLGSTNGRGNTPASLVYLPPNNENVRIRMTASNMNRLRAGLNRNLS